MYICLFLVQVWLIQEYYAPPGMHHMFDPTGFQTNILQIMKSTFHVPEMLVLTTEPPGTSVRLIGCLFLT